MAKHLMVTFSNSLPDRDDEFNKWYSDVHMLETINKLEGFSSAQRYKRADLPGAPEHPYKYLAIYEIEEDQLDKAFEQFKWQRQERAEALAEGRVPYLEVSDSLDREVFLVGFFSPMTERIESERIKKTSGGTS